METNDTKDTKAPRPRRIMKKKRGLAATDEPLAQPVEVLTEPGAVETDHAENETEG